MYVYHVSLVVNWLFHCLYKDNYLSHVLSMVMLFFLVFLDSPGLLQFEVCPLSESGFSVSFQHPVNDSLVCGKLFGWKHLSWDVSLWFF